MKGKTNNLKILFVSSEVFPFSKTGGLADVAGSLPKALARIGGIDVRVITPLYRCVAEGGFELKKIIPGIKHRFSGKIFGFDLFSSRREGVTTYFIRKDKYFSRKELYGTAAGDYPDNALRFGFFSKAVFAAVEAAGFKPDVIHCNDWHTALIPFYLRFKLANDPCYTNMKTLFTIHNLAYQGVFNKIFMYRLGIPGSFFSADALEFYGKLNFLKSGIQYADALSTVSPKYSREILTPEFGCGLEGTLSKRKGKITGILNGADYSEWDPGKDSFIKTNYNSTDAEKKSECKKDLLKHVGLDFPSDRPVLGYVGRLADQKGVDLISGVIDRLVAENIALIVLGKGEDEYNKAFRRAAEKYPGNIRVFQTLDEELAHKIEAGCDIFLMPSRYEPCGLNQMYSMKYGTPPIVRATGGLDDTVVDFNEDSEHGNGFKFVSADTQTFFLAVKRAVLCYENRDMWAKLIRQTMACDFSWKHSAREYVELYEMVKRGER